MAVTDIGRYGMTNVFRLELGVLVGFFAVALLFLSPESNALSDVIEDDLDFLRLKCTAFLPDVVPVSFDYSNLSSLPNQISRKRSLYLFNKHNLAKDWIVIDVTRNENVIADTLKLPLHALKFKKYLAGKRIIILGDGVNYKELEHEALQLRKNIVKEIKLYFGGVDNWLEKDVSVESPLTIAASEYVEESRLGKWVYIYNKSDLLELFASVNSQKTATDPLVRYLLVNEQLSAYKQPLTRLYYQLFELQGGEQALEQFTLDQSRMLSANQERELRARCKGTHDA